VYQRDLRVLPTYGMALGLWAVEAAGALGAYDATRSLHVSQHLEVRGELPAGGELTMAARVAAAWDKGSATVVDVEVEADAFRAVYGIFLPGVGGWGGERGPSAPKPADRGPAIWEGSYATSLEQAALYRLTGDRHPVHIDPAVAAAGGFERPILHGLCTVAIAVVALAHGVGADPGELRELDARMAAPVLPGDALAIQAWSEGADAPYEFEVGVADRTVVKAGRAAFGGLK
jgi:acyl dehydratase